MHPISFSFATAEDANELADLRVLAMRESLERIGRFDPIRARERFLSGFSPSHTRHVMYRDTRAGFFVVKPEEEFLKLDHLYIRPEFQNLGLGSAVLAQVFAEADLLSIDVRVGALVGSDSNRFYVRHGFTLVEQTEFDNYYRRPSSIL